MENEGDIEAKQKYLCKEVMEKGFDADEFTKWIDINKEKGKVLLMRMRTRKMGDGGTRICSQRIPT